jgi:glutamate racemase
MRIGVFDSGIGGQAVAAKLGLLLPDAEIISVNDHDNVPYGTKLPEHVIQLTKRAIAPLLELSCDAIVIACNTATTVSIENLRQTYPHVNFIGLEPMIKPAAKLTKTNTIAVLATLGTLQSNRYEQLKQAWAKNLTVVEPDCKDWALLIENGLSDQINVEATVSSLLANNVDIIVIGCTHYHLIKQRIAKAAGPNVVVLEPTDAIASRIKALIS